MEKLDKREAINEHSLAQARNTCKDQVDCKVELCTALKELRASLFKPTKKLTIEMWFQHKLNPQHLKIWIEQDIKKHNVNFDKKKALEWLEDYEVNYYKTAPFRTLDK